MDKVFIIRSGNSKVFQADGILAGLLGLVAVLIFAAAFWWLLMLGFGIIAAVFLGSLAFCALGVFFAVTARSGR